MKSTRYTLIQRLKQKGDEESWDQFVEIYGGYIYVVLKKFGFSYEECSDLKQDILVKLWAAIPQSRYDETKGRFRSWLGTVIRNTAITYLKKRPIPASELNETITSSPCEEENLDTLINDEWRNYISNLAFENIKVDFSEQSLLVFKGILKGVSVEELAQQYDLKTNSIYRIKNRVKERLVIEIAEIRKDLE